MYKTEVFAYIEQRSNEPLLLQKTLLKIGQIFHVIAQNKPGQQFNVKSAQTLTQNDTFLCKISNWQIL